MELACTLPLHAPSLLGFLAARAVDGVEEIEGATYRRSLRLAHGPAVVRADLRAMTWELEAGDPRDAAEAEARCRALLDLDADPVRIDDALGADPVLREVVAAAPGRRVPGCVEPAEIAVRAVLGQQVSVAAGRTHAGRLTRRLGEPLPDPCGSVTHLFPSPAALAELDPAELPMPRARGRCLVALAGALADGLDPRDRDVLLETDLGVRRGLERLGAPDPIEPHAERWRPWRSYAVQHLWSLARPTTRPSTARSAAGDPAGQHLWSLA